MTGDHNFSSLICGFAHTVCVVGGSGGSSAGGAKSPAEKELTALLPDLSIRSPEVRAALGHALNESLVAYFKVGSEARRNPVEVLANEGQASHCLDNWANSLILLMPREHGKKVRKALGKTKESGDIPNNILRVVF